MLHRIRTNFPYENRYTSYLNALFFNTFKNQNGEKARMAHIKGWRLPDSLKSVE